MALGVVRRRRPASQRVQRARAPASSPGGERVARARAAEAASDGIAADGERRPAAASLARRAVHRRAAASCCPRAPERREDRVNGLPAFVRGRRCRRRSSPGGGRASTPASRSASVDPPVARPGERARRRRRSTRARAPASPRQRGQLAAPAGPSRTHEAAAALAQRVAAARAGSRAGTRVRGRRTRSGRASSRVVEHEHRHDAVVPSRAAAQRRVVVDAQVAPEPDERRGGHRTRVRAT